MDYTVVAKHKEWRELKLRLINWFGFDPVKVCERFEGDLNHIGTIQITGNSFDCYRNKKPDRKKGHQSIMLLWTCRLEIPRTYVAGMTLKEFKERCVIPCMVCFKCDEVVYSCHQHNYQHCSCENVGIDGGSDHNRFETKDNGKNSRSAKIDLLNRKVISDAKS